MTIRSLAFRPTDRSTTNTRSGTPTCVAASPTPGAAYIVSIMSSISRCRLSSNVRDVGGGVSCRPAAPPYLQDWPDHRVRRREAGAHGGVRGRHGALEGRDRVAAEPLQQGVGEHERHHRLADDGRGGHGADVAALDRRRRLGHRRQVDGAERLHERRDRLHVDRDPEVLAVGDAALEPAGVVGRPREAGGARRVAGRRSRRGRASPAATRPRARGRCRRP